MIKAKTDETTGHYGTLPPFDATAEREALPITAAEMKRQFFDAFGELMTLVERCKMAGDPLPVIDDVQCLRDCIMKTRENFLVTRGDTEEQWWQIIKGLSAITNAFDAIDADGLAEKSYVLAAGASKILSVWKEEMEREHAGH